MHSNRLVATLFFALGAAALAITSWIIHRNGAAQGATADGREMLAWAAIVVHVGGVVVFGLATGAMLKGRQWLGAMLCALMMFGAAAYSAWNIASFATAEVVSVTRARELAEKAAQDQHTAALALAKQQQDMRAKLAETQLKILQGALEDAKGRQSRDDVMKAGNKLVADAVGSSTVVVAPAAPDAPKAAPLRSDALAEWLAAYMGWQQTALQASPTLWLALMLILIEVAAWPLASFFWRRPAMVMAAMPIAAPQAALEADPPRAEALPQAEPLRALPAPETAVVQQSENVGQPEPPTPKPPKVGPVVRPPRVPISAEARETLATLGLPEVKPVGPVLERQAAAISAQRFATWLKCIGESGRHSTARLMELYAEFCAADHREPLPYGGQKGLAAALDNRRLGISKTRLTQADGSTAVEWVVSPFRPRKAKETKAPDAEEEPAIDPRKPETMPHNRLGPMTPSKQAEFEADLAGLKAIASQEAPSVKRPPFGLSADAFGWSAATGEPAWLHANAKEMRRWRLAQNHKQRGGQRRVA